MEIYWKIFPAVLAIIHMVVSMVMQFKGRTEEATLSLGWAILLTILALR